MEILYKMSPSVYRLLPLGQAYSHECYSEEGVPEVSPIF